MSLLGSRWHCPADALLQVIGSQPCRWSWLGGPWDLPPTVQVRTLSVASDRKATQTGSTEGQLWAAHLRSRGLGLTRWVWLGLGTRTLLPLSSASPHTGLILRQACPLCWQAGSPRSLSPRGGECLLQQVPRLPLAAQRAHLGHMACLLPAPRISVDQLALELGCGVGPIRTSGPEARKRGQIWGNQNQGTLMGFPEHILCQAPHWGLHLL